jgi:hypothetical protein
MSLVRCNQDVLEAQRTGISMYGVEEDLQNLCCVELWSVHQVSDKFNTGLIFPLACDSKTDSFRKQIG